MTRRYSHLGRREPPTDPRYMGRWRPQQGRTRYRPVQPTLFPFKHHTCRRLPRDLIGGGEVGSVRSELLAVSDFQYLPGAETVRPARVERGGSRRKESRSNSEATGAARFAKGGGCGSKRDGKEGSARLFGLIGLLLILSMVAVVIAVIGGEGRMGARIPLRLLE